MNERVGQFLEQHFGSVLNSRRTALSVVAVLLVSNIVTNRLLPTAWYVPWNGGVAGLLLLLALRGVGLRFSDLGLGQRQHRSGIRWGAYLAILIALTFAIGLAIPATRELFRDRRAIGTGWDTLYRIFVSVPLGTVAVEEIAFRGVLPAVLERHASRLRSVIVSSFLFGLWHILPSANLNRNNAVIRDSLSGPVGRSIAIGGAVLSTAMVGMFFCWLRFQSRSLLAPIITHIASNSFAYAVAWYVLRN